MKKVALVAVFAVALVGIAFAQGMTTNPVAGVKEKAIDVYGNTIQMPRSGVSIYNNNAITSWWGNQQTNYIGLDWGKLTDIGGDGLADEVVDGFNFKYGCNNMDPAGETYLIYYFDSTTGWGNIGVQESGFLFTGLPNGYGLPPLGPGYGWIWGITVDIEGSGYEFLLGNDFGTGMVIGATPLMGGTGNSLGSPSGMNGNGFTGTEDAFDIYFPNGTYNGTYYFGGYPVWATWSGELFGAQDPAAAMTYYGQGSQGNQASFYTTGTWAAGQNVHFMLRKNGNTLPGWLLASRQGSSQYIPSLDITKLVGSFVGGTPRLMANAFIGDYDVLDVTIPNVAGSLRIYTQGAITQLNPIPPADCSNGIYSN
jgi:hypothetical protein